MSNCLNCEHWLRTEDGIIGMCRKQELPGENYRFQYEGCRFYVEGDKRKPFIEKGYAKRVRDYSNVTISPELEAQAAELLKQGVPVVETRKRLRIGAQVMPAVVRRHKAEYEIGAAIRRQARLNRLNINFLPVNPGARRLFGVEFNSHGLVIHCELLTRGTSRRRWNLPGTALRFDGDGSRNTFALQRCRSASSRCSGGMPESPFRGSA